MDIPFLSATPRVVIKVKVDQGFKIKLRADRESLHLLFEDLHFGKGKHHWKVERWQQEVRQFCRHKYFKGVKFTEEEVSAIVLLLYPSFGKTKLKSANL